ncbi:MAG: dTDP-4-dehydrorhamnose 3,5-epimerase [Bacteroidetes bacterium GWE2_41_25]|nr:MAG: dTDP-4-dehydrorhamnose 3,5-epimerase [Bacteroidetes bacterium GWA2_40_15]OFX93671.1 MAG: dTDP-4-dehydrorhamnose 3,5-epimerase [Bacteroidetes bacterium GWC2_40_22]OFY01601.1 MAG: dTDP-4-dehydrorhamnose 3,5-epimerase [Bacteroidetes bacterium GWE2_41_25]OFY61105.1 MAG: dTDP-4-dehydrorhamnose 3,5-epimerase [Bacteroidetes bacterium GWF2_41_9]HAM08804.1 dTDP-4-dehydrorhamnose 3,5-epimerase [Bacteroidales bacterium]
MNFKETGLQGLLIIQPDIFTDSRGYFFESFNQNSFQKSGITFIPVQDNESRSSRGVIRGLHYQLNPHAQAKLIRVVEGKIFDVALDLRRESPTFGKWFGVELDSEKKKQLLIPGGFAHGFSVLSDIAVIQYKCDNVYNPAFERGINLNDPVLNIDWKTGDSEPIISAKDLKNPNFREAEKNF